MVGFRVVYWVSSGCIYVGGGGVVWELSFCFYLLLVRCLVGVYFLKYGNMVLM